MPANISGFLKRRFGVPIGRRSFRHPVDWKESSALIVGFSVLLFASSQVYERSHGYGYGTRPNVTVALDHQHDFEVIMAKEAPLQQGMVEIVCRAERHAEYEGTLVKWGRENLKATAGECCEDCAQTQGCTIWVWCGLRDGCNGHAYRECWLKKALLQDVLPQEGFPNRMIGWTSGSDFASGARQHIQEEDRLRLLEVARTPGNPIVWMDIAINGILYGRVTIVLFADRSPLAAENFRQLCTGENGVAPAGVTGAGRPYSFKGSPLYRIVDRFLVQTGAPTQSIYGETFRDDPEGLKELHNRTGLLSMVNSGPNTSSTHFSFLLVPAPHLDGKYVIFAEIISGIEAMYKVNSLAREAPEGIVGSEAGAVIYDSGEYDKSKLHLESLVKAPLSHKLNLV